VTETETNVSFLVALVPADVLKVEVRSEGPKRFSTREFVDAPIGWGDLRFAIVPLDGGGPGAVHFIGAGHDIVYGSVGFRWGELLDVTSFATVPEDGTAQVRSLELEGTRRTLFAWREAETSKFCLYLADDGARRTLSWCGTTDAIAKVPILSIGPLACDRRVGVIWGTVPSDVAAIEGNGGDGFARIETIAGLPGLGNVRFVLGSLDEPYPGSVWVSFLDASGQPTDQDWLSASCFERPPEPPEA